MKPLPGPGGTSARLDFTESVDPDGRVIFFAVNGRPMLFHGVAGTFFGTLPDWAEAVLRAPAPADSGPGRRPRRRAGVEADLARDVALLRRGSHPSLAPEPRQAGLRCRARPRIINVFLAQACNLRCRYCVNHYGTFGGASSVMSVATARHLVDFVRGIAATTEEPTISLNLLGGEPLLAAEAAHVVARGVRELNLARAGAEIRLTVFTNGTLYRPRLFETLAEDPELGTVVVSLDAWPAAHDRNRPFDQAGRGSYATVLANLRRLMREGVPYSVTCVIAQPYDYIGAAEELHRLGIRRLELKDVIEFIYGGAALPADCRGDFDAWRARYIAYTDYFLDYLHTADPAMHVDRLGLVQEYGRVLNAREGFHRTLACGVADEKVAIAADGRILPCEGFVGHGEFALGNVRDGLAPDRLDRFAARLLQEGQFRTGHEQCRRCFARLICGGGCYAQSYDKTGRLEPCAESTCRVIREKARIDLYFLARLKDEHPATFAAYGGLLD